MKNLLAFSRIYFLFQSLVGGVRARKRCVRDYMTLKPGLRVLDIGCGPGYVVEEMPQCHYVGFDIDCGYIAHAQSHYQDKGRFFCRELTAADVDAMDPFDVVLLFGALHHLDDATAVRMMQLAKRALKKGGYFLSLDGCFVPGQSFIDRTLLQQDRGKYVRTEQGYLALATQAFEQPKAIIRNDYFYLPYTFIIMKCHA